MIALFLSILTYLCRGAIVPIITTDRHSFYEEDTAFFALSLYDNIRNRLVDCSTLMQESIKWEIVDSFHQLNFGLATINESCYHSSLIIAVPLIGMREGSYRFIAFLVSNYIQQYVPFEILAPLNETVNFEATLDKPMYKFGDIGTVTTSVNPQFKFDGIFYKIIIGEETVYGNLSFSKENKALVAFKIPIHSIEKSLISFYYVLKGDSKKLVTLNINIEDYQLFVDFSAECGSISRNADNLIYYYIHDKNFNPVDTNGYIYKSCKNNQSAIQEFSTQYKGRGKVSIYFENMCSYWIELHNRMDKYYFDFYNSGIILHTENTVINKSSSLLVSVQSSFTNELPCLLSVYNKGVKLLHKNIMVINGNNSYDIQFSTLNINEGVISVTISDQNEDNFYAEKLLFLIDNTPLHANVHYIQHDYYQGDNVTLKFYPLLDSIPLNAVLNIKITSQKAYCPKSLAYGMLFDNEVLNHNNENAIDYDIVNNIHKAPAESLEFALDLILNCQQWRKLSNMLCRMGLPESSYQLLCYAIPKTQKIPMQLLQVLKRQTHVDSDDFKLSPIFRAKSTAPLPVATQKEYHIIDISGYSNNNPQFNGETLLFKMLECNKECYINFNVGNTIGEYIMHYSVISQDGKTQSYQNIIHIRPKVYASYFLPSTITQNDQIYLHMDIRNNLNSSIEFAAQSEYKNSISILKDTTTCKSMGTASLVTTLSFSEAGKGIHTIRFLNKEKATLFESSKQIKIVKLVEDTVQEMDWTITSHNCSENISFNSARTLYGSLSALIVDSINWLKHNPIFTLDYNLTSLFSNTYLFSMIDSSDLHMLYAIRKEIERLSQHLSIKQIISHSFSRSNYIADAIIKLSSMQNEFQIKDYYFLIELLTTELAQYKTGKGEFMLSRNNGIPSNYALSDANTAYALFALSYAGDLTCQAELEYVIATALESNDPYLIALAALNSYYYKDSHFAELINKLATLQSDNGGFYSAKASAFNSYSTALDIETTSISILAMKKSELFDSNIVKAIEFLIVKGALQFSPQTHFLSLLAFKIARDLIPSFEALINEEGSDGSSLPIDSEAPYHYYPMMQLKSKDCSSISLISVSSKQTNIEAESNISMSVDFSTKTLQINEVGTVLIKIYNPSEITHGQIIAKIRFPTGLMPIEDGLSQIVNINDNEITILIQELKNSVISMFKIPGKAVLKGVFRWPASTVQIINNGEKYIAENGAELTIK